MDQQVARVDLLLLAQIEESMGQLATSPTLTCPNQSRPQREQQEGTDYLGGHGAAEEAGAGAQALDDGAPCQQAPGCSSRGCRRRSERAAERRIAADAMGVEETNRT